MTLKFYRPDDQLYFLHIPKAAGTTFRMFLENTFDNNDICPAYDFFSVTQIPYKRLQKYRLVRGHMGSNFINYIDVRPFTVTMIRNPVDRALSHFNYIRRDPTHPKYKLINEQKMSLMDLLAVPKLRGEFENFQTKALAHNVEHETLRHIAKNSSNPLEFQQAFQKIKPPLDNSEMLELAMKRLREIEFVGVVNRFEESMQLASYQLGFHPPQQVQKLNVNYSRQSQADTDEIRHLLKEKNSLDTKLYRLAQEIFEERYNQMTHKLVKDHYRTVFSQQSEVMERVDLNFSAKIQGDGWLQREEYARHGIVRWTGPGTSSVLDFNLKPGKAYEVRVSIVDAVAEDVLQSFAISCDGRMLPTRIKKELTSHTAIAMLDAEMVSDGITSIEFTVNRVASEPESGSELINHNSNRQCGVAIKKVILTPV